MHRLCLLWMQLLMLWRAWRKARYLEGMNTALVLLFVNPRKPAMKTTFIWTGHVRLTRYGRASWNCTRHHTTWSFDPFWKPVPAAKNRNKLYIYIHTYIYKDPTYTWVLEFCNLQSGVEMESKLCRFHAIERQSAFLCAGDIVEARHDVQSFVFFACQELLWKA